MSYSSRTRDFYRVLVSSVTGLASVGALSATGLIAGHSAADYEADQVAKAAKERAEYDAYLAQKAAYEAAVAAAEKPRIIWKKRPTKTRTSVRYIQGGTSTVGTGGSVGSGGGGDASGGGGGAGGGGGGGGGGGTTPPPPPPPPPPSSGS
ncbi:MAG: hypothetical protein WAW88_10220 [Nocardioides sp.]